jgi:hypothetical protein
MRVVRSIVFALAVAFLCWGGGRAMYAQSGGSSGSVHGVVADPSGGAVPGASVELHNPVSGYSATVTTDTSGEFRFLNVPMNPYRLVIRKDGFAITSQDVDIRSAVPIELKLALKLAAANESVQVEASSADILENTSTAHTDVDETLAEKLPIQSSASALSSMITLASPGVAADSNGMFHPLGEHADTTFVVDGQPISDQQSKIYSNQLPMDAVESLEVVSGAPAAEFGDKTSLTAKVTTRSGLGTAKPFGSLATEYGSFGTGTTHGTLGFGSKRVGNFLAFSGTNSGRYLDPPEFSTMHAKGNSEGAFDRLDFQPSTADSVHLNVSLGRSWFQTPNTFDQQAAGQDQRQQIWTWNVAPSWTHLFGTGSLLNVEAYVRQDRVGYSPSANLFADQPATIAQNRQLTNTGFRVDYSIVRGKHNAKFGASLTHTFLDEHFTMGLTDPAFNAVCFSDPGLTAPVMNQPALRDPSQCTAPGFFPNTPDNGFLPGLVPFDLTRGGSLFAFTGHTDVKQEAAYGQDTLTVGQLSLTGGLRFDNYAGLSSGHSFQPRAGASYFIKSTGTVLRLSYARLFETPYNENLILSSSTGAGGLGTVVFGAQAVTPLNPGRRDQFNAGFQQAFGKALVVDADYSWKFTHTDFDFDTVFSTAVVFPIEWNKSKIDGFSIRLSVPEHKGVTAYTVLGHTRSRFFNPEIGGLIFNSPLAAGVFRIDHDQAFQQSTHVQYQFPKKGPWLAFTWRYDSGLVAGSVPDYATALALTADQQAAIGLYCGSTFATLTAPITACSTGTPRGALRVRIPADGTENDDTNPPRITPRNLFDAAVGQDNLFHTDRVKWNLRVSVLNLTNKVALYNFLSTFSGTHFIAPRTVQAELGMNF